DWPGAQPQTGARKAADELLLTELRDDQWLTLARPSRSKSARTASIELVASSSRALSSATPIPASASRSARNTSPARELRRCVLPVQALRTTSSPSSSRQLSASG